MKKLLLVFLLMWGVSFISKAQGAKERVYHVKKGVVERVAGEKPDVLPPTDEWQAFGIGFFPGFPAGVEHCNVYGLKLGLPFSTGFGRVWGVEASIFSSSTDYIKGFQTSVFANVAKYLEGVQAGLVNVVKVKSKGTQFGLVNYSNETGLQFGLVNVISGATFPFIPLINYQGTPKRSTYIQKAPPVE